TGVTSGNPQTVNLTVSGCPSGASCTLSPTSITSGNGSTLTINSGTAAGGTYTVTVTGAGTSNMHSTTEALTVNGTTPTNDIYITASPTSVNLTAGNSGTSTISTVLTSGNAQSIALSASGMPAGTTATFATNPINSGESSLLTLATSATTPAGTYTITV